MISSKRDRERRAKAIGRWFLSPKKDKTLWLNHMFPIVLVVSFIFYVYSL
jgi:hypothetical protein